ncbi:MAG: hypothetical protein IJA10_10295 [Lachnospiraceae bacterium]|nr:hypothetical protein [Lachnospiraceae bacterium]
MIETNIKARNYLQNEVVRICNVKQQIFYISNNVYPIDIYTSYDDKNDRKIIVMIFEKENTKELYQKWLNYEVD